MPDLLTDQFKKIHFSLTDSNVFRLDHINQRQPDVTPPQNFEHKSRQKTFETKMAEKGGFLDFD